MPICLNCTLAYSATLKMKGNTEKASDDDTFNQEKNTKHEVTSKSCPVKNVTVFRDRAEVNRVVDVDIVPGSMEVVVKDLPPSVVEDSVR